MYARPRDAAQYIINVPTAIHSALATPALHRIGSRRVALSTTDTHRVLQTGLVQKNLVVQYLEPLFYQREIRIRLSITVSMRLPTIGAVEQSLKACCSRVFRDDNVSK
jgi:hypothetical protein